MSESLLVSTAGLRREGLDRLGLVARLIGQGDRIRAVEWLARTPLSHAAAPASVRELPVAETGDDRPLVSWRLFRLATQGENHAVRQHAPGYAITAYPAGAGNVAFEIRASTR